MHALGAGGIEADGAQAGQLLHYAGKGLVAGRTRWLPRPAQHAQGRALLGREHRIQRLRLSGGQVAGELARDVALGHDQGRGDQALHDTRAGSDDPAPAQLVHQRRGDRQGVCGGQRHRQQPGQHVAAVSRRVHAEAERLAQVVELFLPRLPPGGVGGERVGADMDLLGDEAQRWFGDGLAGPQQPAGVAEGAKLQGVAELVGGAAAPVHRGQVRPVQGPVPDEVGFGDRQGEQGIQLRFGERASSRHGGLSQSGCRLIATVRARAGTRACRPPSGVSSIGTARRALLPGFDLRQSCARQERDLAAFAERAGYEVVGTYKETASGVKLDRAERRKVMALAQARHIDAVLVTELSRWGRSTTDLLATLKELEARRVSLVALNGMAFDLTTPHGRMMATLLAGIAEFERELTQERIRSGIAAAKARGKQLGRQPGQRPKSDRLAPKVLALIAQGRSYRLIGREVGLSKNTVAGIVTRNRTVGR